MTRTALAAAPSLPGAAVTGAPGADPRSYGGEVTGTARLANIVGGGALLLFATAGTLSVGAPSHEMSYVSYARPGTGPVLDLSTVLRVPTPTATIGEDTATAATVSEAELVRWLHEASGLTWDQLGRVFGVSRRAVHLWANGGRLNAGNAARLAEFVQIVRELPARNAIDRRAHLLAAGRDGRSIVDRMRDRGRDGDISASPWSPAQLLGSDDDRRSGTS